MRMNCKKMWDVRGCVEKGRKLESSRIKNATNGIKMDWTVKTISINMH